MSGEVHLTKLWVSEKNRDAEFTIDQLDFGIFGQRLKSLQDVILFGLAILLNRADFLLNLLFLLFLNFGIFFNIFFGFVSELLKLRLSSISQ